MGFKTLSPPAKPSTANPDGVRISVTRTRKDDPNSGLRVNVAIGANVFEQMGATDLAQVLVGEGPDASKLQLRLFQEGETPELAFKVKVLRETAIVQGIILAGVKREHKRCDVPHDLHKQVLTFALPAEIFRAPPTMHVTGGGG